MCLDCEPQTGERWGMHKGGTPAHQPTTETRRQAKLCASFGLSGQQIAEVVGITQTTLTKYYSQEIEVGRLVATISVVRNLYCLATRNSFRAVRAIETWFRYVEPRSELASLPRLGKKAEAERAAEEAPPAG